MRRYPDDGRWLVLLLRALEAELDATYRLAALMGWMEDGRDLLHTWTHRVATDPRWPRGRPSDDDEPADPDRYSSDHRVLIRALSGAWGSSLAAIQRSPGASLKGGGCATKPCTTASTCMLSVMRCTSARSAVRRPIRESIARRWARAITSAL